MLDIELIRSDPEAVRAALLTRIDSVDLSPILKADESRRAKASEVEQARSELKKRSREVGELRRSGEDATEQQEAAAQLGDRIAVLQADLRETENRLRLLLMELPNLPDPEVKAGGKEANEVVRVWGEAPDLGSSPRDHVELCTDLGLVDFQRGVKLGGSGHWLYRGHGAALEWALLDFFAREHYRAGYEFMLPPHLLTEESGFAAGQFPKFHDDVFHLAGDEGERTSFLLPTAETAILNTYRDEIIPVAELPKKLFAYTPCYRKESGGYRTEERGTIRGHQFNKVEMFQFVAPEDAEAAFTELLGRSQSLVEQLGLHYRTSKLASRDVSATMAKTYDVEVWLPSLGTYKEVSSVSWAGDYQARRAAIRYRAEGDKKTRFVHTLNASGLATSRLLPAILEQNQQPDGSVRVPEPLRPWVGTDVLSPVR
ncbi:MULTISPECIES: serine--tRNA ligase [unclassified Streptomyces]|uniref:serine--tRNA ligase n=1 Tax=unclassified Streptomyces TaxID=2593676 RepID=UPI000DAF0EB6|nr:MULTISPECIES: serine--tRNA ligase [unclassified Streptomyces]PZT72140.1 serine--tRNA ligase [Streptomyces sp. AC1-42T]PZT81539.1 serine--tRNA ligase [Streptomyces sp. AC1-42W]